MLKIPKLLTLEKISQYQTALKDADWQDGSVTAGHQAQKVKNNSQLSEGSETARVLGENILLALSRSQTFMAAALPAKIYPPMFNRYRAGASFGLHVDNAIRKVPGASVKLRSDLSITVFLSDPDSYVGGDLIIKNAYDQHEIKLEPGDAILYPADSLHQVAPVTDGCRYAAVFWIQSLVRNSQHRRILYDLDLSIQALTKMDEENPEVTRLTGVYHNLLREWSDV